MSKPNFFAGIEALNCLLQTEFAEPERDIDLTLDFIDLPVWFSFKSDKKNQTLKVYTQNELYNKDEEMAFEKGSMVMDRKTGQGTAKGSSDIVKNLEAFFFACKNINCLILEKGLEPLFEGLDPENAGILLSVNEGEPEWKVVSGDERPDLTVETLFGGTTVGRPYMEGFMDRSKFDLMSFDEKLEAAENGDEDAMEAVAMTYLNGDEDEGIEKKPELAVHWFTKLAELDNSDAQYNLGLHCAKGHGIKRDFAKAAYWMQRAADNGDEDAPALIEKFIKAAEASEKIDSGDAQAQADLADVLMALANSLEQAGTTLDDYERAFKLAQKSAAQNNGDGMWILALAYTHGRGVDVDVETAIEYFRKGAELGHAACQHSLGCHYINGEHLEEDEKKAFDLFRKSAEQGYGLAMKDLGRCYQFGTGCTGNMQTALEWYEKASEVLDDPELDQRVAAFRHLADISPDWGEDYDGEDCFDEDEDDDFSDDTADFNEIIRQKLEAAGKDSSDEAIADMSPDDVFALFSDEEDDEEE